MVNPIFVFSVCVCGSASFGFDSSFSQVLFLWVLRDDKGKCALVSIGNLAVKIL